MTEVEKQLKAIRFFIFIGVLALIVSAVADMQGLFFQMRMHNEIGQKMQKMSKMDFPSVGYSDFVKKAYSLSRDFKFKELKALSLEQLKENPNDSYAYFYLGMAQYSMKEYEPAVKSLEKSLEIVPSWKELVDPYLTAAKAMLKKK